MKTKFRVEDIGKKEGQLGELRREELMPLPAPYNDLNSEPVHHPLTAKQKERLDDSFDGFSGIGLVKPKSKEEEEKFVRRFLEGLEKSFQEESNWTFLQPLEHSLEYCVKCQLCSDACPVYVSSGKKEFYRPTFRGEVLRRIVKKYLKKRGPLLSRLTGTDIDLNWTTLARLAESAYRCTICRRCAQVCLIGVDNALITREIRKIFSQELGIAPIELHEKGTVQQLKVGSSTGITPKALADLLEFMEEEIEEKTGKKIKIPVDKMGAEYLLLHNAGEFLAWPESLEAYAILYDAAGIDWTISSEQVGYDAVNYGTWYDDVQFARIAIKHAQSGKNLKVKKISMAECGHAHKAFMVVADRVLTGDLNIPRESSIPLMEEIVNSGKIKFDPSRNDFPVTLHDPCNYVRLMGIVEPQRRILRKLAPKFREMEPHGVENYCCGGGSGFAIMQGLNFPDWRSSVSGRMKLKQIVEAFQDAPGPEVQKYVCAPCSNCKGQIRELFNYYHVPEKSGIFYGGLVELIVNAMTDLEKPFIGWDFH